MLANQSSKSFGIHPLIGKLMPMHHAHASNKHLAFKFPPPEVVVEEEPNGK